ncbi:MAG: AAA domain-containing protein [Candidatus Lokiarchaeota archaeon]|nr:AAA domain-containing protein [Candidatus Lokiarchaeota archaeon]
MSNLKESFHNGEYEDIMLKYINLLADLEIKFNKFILKRYFNKQPVISNSHIDSEGNIIKLKYTLADILLIGAITQSSILLSGSSGSGKTLLAKLVTRFLFGKNGYTRKNITPDMNEQDFIDIDFGAIKEGKRLKEAISADEIFSRPSLIIDEANRAPPIVQNRLMQVLENNIDLKSKIVHAGIKLNSDMYYHWNILTLNYGSEYAGTSRVDRALKDRVIFNIPIDNFPPTLNDQIKMIRSDLNEILESNINSKEEFIVEIFQNLEKIGLSIEAEALILYLGFASNCVKSPSGSKYGILFSPDYCKDNDCQYARNPPLNKICPFTYAPSNRVLRKLVHAAKGFTLLKLAKIYNYYEENELSFKEKGLEDLNIEVTLEDIISIAPLILNEKISMNRDWIINNFHGNQYFAIKFFLEVIENQLNFFMNNLLKPLYLEKKGEDLSEKDIGIRNKAKKDDFHFEGLIKYVKEHLI